VKRRCCVLYGKHRGGRDGLIGVARGKLIVRESVDGAYSASSSAHDHSSFRGRLSLPHDEIFGFVTCDGLIFFSSGGTISSMASASDLVASTSEGSLSSLWEDRNKSGNCVSAFGFDSKIPASRSSFYHIADCPEVILIRESPK